MSGIEDDVSTRFLERLPEAEEISDGIVIGLRRAFADGRMPKPESLVQMISDASGEPLT